jgi:hypothetical protein
MMRRHAELSSTAPGGTPKPRAGTRLVSGRRIRLAELRGAGMALVLLSASSCAARPSEPDPRVLQTQVGPIGVEVRGSVGGLTNVDVTRLVQAGAVEACPGRVSSHPGDVGGPPLSMIWHLQDLGGRPPTVTITARLFNAGHQVSFAFDHTLPPDVAPDAVFERAVSGVACALFSKAGYLNNAQPMG